ncbi:hypothetical protein ABH905_001389 [Pseudomonas frederiksbergensis]
MHCFGTFISQQVLINALALNPEIDETIAAIGTQLLESACIGLANENPTVIVSTLPQIQTPHKKSRIVIYHFLCKPTLIN